MKVLLHPDKDDPAGLVAEGPFGARVPVLDGALVLLYGFDGTPDGPGRGFPEDGTPFMPPTLVDVAWARAMRVLATGILNSDPERYRGTVTGPFSWECASHRAILKVVVNSTVRSVETQRNSWRLNTWQGGGNGLGDGLYKTFLVSEPWPDGHDSRVDLIVPGLATPHDFGLWYGWVGARAAYALGTAVAHLYGGRVEVRAG